MNSMDMRKRYFSSKLLIGISVLLLCLLTFIDDITGSLKPFSILIPVIQNADEQEAGEDRRNISSYTFTAGGETSRLSRPSPFFEACSAGSECQKYRVCSDSSHNRAPPFSQV
jgi:hypothetical protein